MFIYRQKPDDSSNLNSKQPKRESGRSRKRKIEESRNSTVSADLSPRTKRRNHKSFIKGIPTPGRSKRSTNRTCPVCCETDLSNDSVQTHVSCSAGCGVDMCRSCFVRWIDVVIQNGEHADKILPDGSISCVSCTSFYGPDVLHRTLPSKQSRQISELCRARYAPQYSF